MNNWWDQFGNAAFEGAAATQLDPTEVHTMPWSIPINGLFLLVLIIAIAVVFALGWATGKGKK